MASPLPLAFSDSRSLRAFVDRFSAELVTLDGTRVHREADASVYAALPGPYERHVIYGAAISLSSIMPSLLFSRILRYGFCDRGPLATAMGIDQPLSQAVLSIPTVLRRPGEPAGRVAVSCGG